MILPPRTHPRRSPRAGATRAEWQVFVYGASGFLLLAALCLFLVSRLGA